MQITDITTPLTLPPPKVPRSPGVHVSGIIRALALEVGILDKKWADELSLSDAREITDQTAILRIRIGLAWEEHLLPTLQAIDHPRELKLQGIYMTHDGESVDQIYTGARDFQLICHEVKSTYKSAKVKAPYPDYKEQLKKEWLWITQIKAYCKALETRFARIYILFICGDYSYPISPMHRMYEIEFDQEEIDVNWNMLVQYRDHKIEEQNAAG